MRARFIYQKRYSACFVPHIALAQIFSRSALRAGLGLMMTQGFSPRAKLSFGPELPAGVVALNEPVDMYFVDESAGLAGGMNGSLMDGSAGLVGRMNASLPEGFSVSKVMFPKEDAPNLGKECKHAEYFLRCHIDLLDWAKSFYAEAVTCINHYEDWLRLVIKAPAQNPIGGFVKHLLGQNVIAGWHDINIVREAVGTYDILKDRVILSE